MVNDGKIFISRYSYFKKSFSGVRHGFSEFFQEACQGVFFLRGEDCDSFFHAFLVGGKGLSDQAPSFVREINKCHAGIVGGCVAADQGTIGEPVNRSGDRAAGQEYFFAHGIDGEGTLVEKHLQNGKVREAQVQGINTPFVISFHRLEGFPEHEPEMDSFDFFRSHDRQPIIKYLDVKLSGRIFLLFVFWNGYATEIFDLKHLLKRRRQSPAEEAANTISHGIGLAGAVALAPVLILTTLQKQNAYALVASCIFAASVILLYLASTLYHALSYNKAKRLFQIFDHSAIFLLIAGSYTPFTLGVLQGTWGWTLFGIIWGLAIIGIGLKIGFGARYPRLSTALYLVMGWLVVLAIKPLWEQMPRAGFYWLVAGGIAYTLGVVFYVAERLKYSHFIWHLFVLTGTACHYITILFYA